MTSLKAALLVAAASVAFTAFPSDAADYPARPVRIIVGFAAGGAPDTLARVIGDKLAQDWGQPVVVENRTGAQGNTRDGRGRQEPQPTATRWRWCRSATRRSIRR